MRTITILLTLAPLAVCADSREFFEMRVRPVLAKNCFGCHTQTRMGGLELSSRDNLLKGGKTGPAVKPGSPEDSLLIQAVRQTHERLKMPPQGKLSDAEIADLAAWVKDGAVWPESGKPAVKAKEYLITPEQRSYWAFQPVRKQDPPKVKGAKSAIDAFVLARLDAKGLKQVKTADKRTLLRRLTYDLTGLPPKPEDVDAFLADNSANAYPRVVDRLLASPQFGERWGRFWLDIARYSDDRLNSTQDDPYANAYRYRDWVIQSFNEDLPYDVFVKAQIAGDLFDNGKHVAGLGFYALSPEFQDDRVDATGRGFLALTVACAQCHDHKFDPIPTKDFYSLTGVFTSTKLGEHPLAPKAEVEEWAKRKKAVDEQQQRLTDFLEAQANQLAMILASESAAYLRAAREVAAKKAVAGKAAKASHLDKETLERWVKYLSAEKDHPYVNGWQDESKLPAGEFQEFVLKLLKEKKEIDDINFVRLGGSNKRGDLASADLASLPRDKQVFWRQLFASPNGILYYGDKKIDRFLEGTYKQHLENTRAELERRKKALPEQYPFLHVIEDVAKPKNARVQIRGNRENLGDEVPRHTLSILCDGEPKTFDKGAGRLELAESIANAKNPLTARVAVNRIWAELFGIGIVRTLSNFGQLGEKASHPELLDYLAARFVELGWSNKKLIRELVLTSTYQLSSSTEEKNMAADPDNRLLWHAARRRMDVEALRDSLLAATGELDLTPGGKPQKIDDPKNVRRTVYGFVSRRRLNGDLALFDFPNPNSLSESRVMTATPLQQLFFLNSEFVMDRAKALAAKLEKKAGDDSARIREAYKELYFRQPGAQEVALGLEFLKSGPDAWPRYAQVLLSANEFLFVN